MIIFGLLGIVVGTFLVISGAGIIAMMNAPEVWWIWGDENPPDPEELLIQAIIYLFVGSMILQSVWSSSMFG
jgi:hypothetical protein